MASHDKPAADEQTSDPLDEALALFQALEEMPLPDSFPDASSAAPAVAADDDADWFSSLTDVPWLQQPAEEPATFGSVTELPDLAHDLLHPPEPEAIAAEEPNLDSCPLPPAVWPELTHKPDAPAREGVALAGTSGLCENSGHTDPGPPSPTASAFLDVRLAQQVLPAEPEPPLVLDAVPPVETVLGKPYIPFGLAGSDYAVALTNVREVGTPPVLTPLPHVPDWLLGVGNLRGDVVSVVDLRLFLGLPVVRAARLPEQASHLPLGQRRLLVVHSTQDDLTLGLLVDATRALCRLPDDRITEVMSPVEPPVLPYLVGQADHAARTLRILDLERLLQAPELRQFEAV